MKLRYYTESLFTNIKFEGSIASAKELSSAVDKFLGGMERLKVKETDVLLYCGRKVELILKMVNNEVIVTTAKPSNIKEATLVKYMNLEDYGLYKSIKTLI